MPVLLRNSRDLPPVTSFMGWVRIPACAPGGRLALDAERRLREIGARLSLNSFLPADSGEDLAAAQRVLGQRIGL